MSGRRPSLFLLLLAVSVLAAAPARAEMPEPGVMLRLIVGEEEHVSHALRGAPYDTLRGLADSVMEFARTAQAVP
jgi:hypothetical protein